MPLKNIRYLLVIVIVLVFPFFVKGLDPRLEIYPSVILPSGATTIKITDNTKVLLSNIYGYTMEGKRKKLDKKAFLYPIPTLEHYYVLKNRHFGLKEEINRNFITNRLKIPVQMESNTISTYKIDQR